MHDTFVQIIIILVYISPKAEMHGVILGALPY